MAGRDHLIGYRALGRHGKLGVVVADEDGVSTSSTLVIRGGASSALLFVVPWERVLSVDRRGRMVEVDADLADFVPSLLEDGTVQLRFESG